MPITIRPADLHQAAAVSQVARLLDAPVSTAETKCAKWGRDNVPVGLREKGLEAPVYFRVSVPIYFVVVRSPSFGVF